MGFLQALRRQLGLLPVRITLLFAATLVGTAVYLQGALFGYLERDLSSILMTQSLADMERAMADAVAVLSDDEVATENRRRYMEQLQHELAGADVAVYDVTGKREFAGAGSQLPLELATPVPSASVQASATGPAVRTGNASARPFLYAPLLQGEHLIGWQAMAVDLSLQVTLTRVFRERVIGGFLAVAALIVASGLYLRSYTRRNIGALLRFTRQIAQSHWDAPLPARLNGEFQQLGAAIDQMQSGLSGYERQRQLLLARISHDILSPLSTVRMISSINIDDSMTALDRRDWETISGCAEQVSRLLEDLKYVMRRQLDPLADKGQRVDLQLVATQVVGYYAARTRQRNLSLHLAAGVPDTPLCVAGERTRMVQLLGNLLDNALTHGKATEIHVRLEEESEWVRLQVQDNGVGIPPDVLPHIFGSEFTTGPLTDRAGSHQGLGLAIVAEIVRTYGGTIAACSEPQHGTTFTILLPASPCWGSVAG